MFATNHQLFSLLQVIFKSCKLIPVMIGGVLIQGTACTHHVPTLTPVVCALVHLICAVHLVHLARDVVSW